MFTVADDKFPGYAGANGRYRYAKVRLQQHVSAVLTVAPRYENTAFVQAFPEMKTIATFASPEDYALESEVMNAHQKATTGKYL